MTTNTSALRIGLLYRGDRAAGNGGSDRADAMLGPLFQTLSERGVTAERVVYADEAIAAVRDQVLQLDGVLVGSTPFRTARIERNSTTSCERCPRAASGCRLTRT